MKSKRLTSGALFLSVLLITLNSVEIANADSFQNNCPKGYTCFTKGGSSYGKVAGNNSDWRNLPGDWDNKARRFYNNGRTHMNVLCENYGSRPSGICFELFIGSDARYPSGTPGRVSSNHWFPE